MKNKLLISLALFLVWFQFFSCSTEYDGVEPGNEKPVVNFYETDDITSNKKTKIQWYGNDVDGITTKYYYVVTTDTTIEESDVRDVLEEDLWRSTDSTYAWIALPYQKFNADTVFYDEGTYDGYDPVGDSTVVEDFKAVYSRFFVYGVDELGGESKKIQSKIFKRTNRRPKFPMVNSKKLSGIKGFADYWHTIGPDSAEMILEEETEYWKAFDFEWVGEDPDGPEVDLEFRWELWQRTSDGQEDSIRIEWTHKTEWSEELEDSVDVEDWSVNHLRTKFDDEIYNSDPQGKYRFKVFVRDDAYQESENHATVNFEVYSPSFEKGIILIDDTDEAAYDKLADPAELTRADYAGNPDPTSVTEFYRSLLEDAGYKPEGDMSVEKEYWYKIVKFGSIEDDSGKRYTPTVRDLINYRLLIIASDDRSNDNGVKFLGETDYTDYIKTLEDYISVGGYIFVMGNSILYPEEYSTNPQVLPVTEYKEPLRQVFESSIYDYVSEVVQYPKTKPRLRVFFSKYFGIYSMTFPEQKTFYTVPGTEGRSPLEQYCDDPNPASNYDFTGIKLYPHVTEGNFKEIIRIDSSKVNEAWFNIVDPKSGEDRMFQLALKENGTVFTGVPTIETFKGESVYEYYSIYDLSDNDYYNSYEDDGMAHSLWSSHYYTESFEDGLEESSLNWNMITDPSWVQGPIRSGYSGRYSLIAEPAPDDSLEKNYEISTDVELESNGHISFMYKTDTFEDENGRDYLDFYVNGENMSQNDSLWGGVNDWRSVKYELLPGKYTFKWSYSKRELDGSLSPSDYTVSIDGLEIYDSSHSEVTQRSGSVGTRYIGEDYVFRTAFFTIPSYFLNHDDMKEMFSEMIDWFKIKEEYDTEKRGSVR